MKTIKFLSIAALALVGAMMTGCSSDDFANNPQQPTKQDNIVTVTTTIGLGGNDDATNRALAIDYANTKLTKTFAVGDQVVLMYENTGWDAVKAVSQALTAGDISADGKSAKLTFTLVNPRENSAVNFMYPAPLIGDDGIIKSTFYSQAGTLSDVASKDYAHWDGTLTGTTLPANVTLENQFAIIAFTLKDGKGTADTSDDTDITSTITGMTISTGDKTYTVTRTAADGPIYVIMMTTDDATINITATDGTKNYTKTLTGKTYAQNNFYQSTLLMAEAAPSVTNVFTINAGGNQVQFSQGNLQYQASTDTWRFAEHQYDYVGDAAGNNTSSGRETQSDWIDLFGWGTSGKTFASGYGTAYQPWTTSSSNSQYGPTDGASGLTGTYANGDWGVNMGTGWRTLTSDEWTYLFNTRTTGGTVFGTAQARYTEATINTDGTGVNGIILFPDGVDIASSEVTTAGAVNSGSTWATKCTTAQWAALDAKGCAFLPAAGHRMESYVEHVGISGYYWSSTGEGYYEAYYLDFSSGVTPAYNNARYYGNSVRLVKDVAAP